LSDWSGILEPIDLGMTGKAESETAYSRGTATWTKLLTRQKNFEIPLHYGSKSF
jgi:hypothetical protein